MIQCTARLLLSACAAGGRVLTEGFWDTFATSFRASKMICLEVYKVSPSNSATSMFDFYIRGEPARAGGMAFSFRRARARVRARGRPA